MANGPDFTADPQFDRFAAGQPVDRAAPVTSMVQLHRRVTFQEFEELHKLLGIGMKIAEQLQWQVAERGLAPFERSVGPVAGDVCLGFSRIARAIRQIIVLERELIGLREPPPERAARAPDAEARPAAQDPETTAAETRPERAESFADPEIERDDLNDLDDYDDYDDYDRGPIDQIKARIRRTLGVPSRAEPGTPRPPERHNRTAPDADPAQMPPAAEHHPAPIRPVLKRDPPGGTGPP